MKKKETTVSSRKPIVNLHKYYKRMMAFMPKQKRDDFKNLMLKAVHEEKINRENSKRSKGKQSEEE